MQRRRRLTGAAVLTALLAACLVACGSGSTGSSEASCAGPYLDDQPPNGQYGGAAPTASPGETLSIHGHGYTFTCNDTGGDDSVKPMAPVHLTLTLPGGQTMLLGEFTPHGRDMGFYARVHLPAAAQAGTATIHDDQTYPETFRFKVRASR